MFKTLAQVIALYEAQRPAQTALTPLGAATATALRLKRQLLALDAEQRTTVLAELVTATSSEAGCGFSLLVSRPPTPDPEVA